MKKREEVSIKMAEILPKLFSRIREKYELPEDTIVEYTSKTRFLTFLIKREGDKDDTE